MTQKIWLCRSGTETRDITISSDVLKRAFLQVLHVILFSEGSQIFESFLCSWLPAHKYCLIYGVLPIYDGLVTFVSYDHVIVYIDSRHMVLDRFDSPFCQLNQKE
jgi:hypothetical protein